MAKHIPLWFTLFGVIAGVYVILPFLAPVFMEIGWTGAGKVIYFIYSWLCHQLPQRSFFLFGRQLTYSMAEVQNAWQNTNNPLILRQFIGNPTLGWKVAWSDRMISMFTSIWLFGLVAAAKAVEALSWWGWSSPAAYGFGWHQPSHQRPVWYWTGFRDSNTWLAALTQQALPPTFYSGDAWGSFNSLMRLFTGLLFGLGIVWFCFPYLDDTFSSQAPSLRRIPAYPQHKGPEVSHLEDFH
jgi:uncharacterized membrane protein